MSTERLVVDEAVADEFVAKFAARARELVMGDPRVNPGCVIGPMVASESGTRLNAMIDDALSKGAVLACGGKANGAIMAATIVDHVKPGMTIYGDETFGPITTVVRVKGVEEAVAMRIESGSVHVNGSTVQNEAQAPYGGTKNSGYGKFDGRAVIDEFTELKWITIEPSVQQYPV
jgi:salicylaldehyde dehydrogenase